MNILICDDIQADAKELDRLLCESGFRVSTTVFHAGHDALDYIQSGAVVDCCFLDIVMPDMSGVTLAEALRNDGFNGKLIFLSTSREYGPEVVAVEAFGYLLKPPTPESIAAILHKLKLARENADTGSILVKTSSGFKNIRYRDISYVEVIDHYVYFRLIHASEVEVPSTFGDIAQELLRDDRFIQCHRSYVVNMDDIAEIAERDVIMQTAQKYRLQEDTTRRKAFISNASSEAENGRKFKCGDCGIAYSRFELYRPVYDFSVQIQ